LRSTTTPSWLSGFSSKKVRTKASTAPAITTARSGRMSASPAARDRSTTS
jgi:hypothetical protein